ncbi:MAG: AI-2E family transporter [Vicinamibacteria bacterium]|nr:AI-2E family transporter [Vicinamibacteria bacterium]
MSEPAAPRTHRRYLIPLVITLLAIFVLAFLVFRHFLCDFVVAGSVALLIGPAYRRLSKAFGSRRGLAAGLLVFLVAVLILVPVTIAAGVLGRQTVTAFEWIRPKLQPQALHDLLNDLASNRYPWIDEWVKVDEETVSEILSEGLSRLVHGANRVVQMLVGGLTSALLDLVIFLLMLFFLLRDGGALRAEMSRVSPLSDRQENLILEHLGKTIKGVLLAMIVVPLSQGAVALAGFLILGVPAPLLWALLVVLAALVPLIGSPLGWVPAVIYLFFTGGHWLWMLIFGALGISGIDNLVKPLVLRDTAQIHPMLGFLAILGGLLTFGPLGFLIGPVVLSLVLSALRIYHSDVLRSLD